MLLIIIVVVEPHPETGMAAGHKNANSDRAVQFDFSISAVRRAPCSVLRAPCAPAAAVSAMQTA